MNDVIFKGNLGYIVGNNGTVLKTSNNGISWINNNINWTPEIPNSAFGIHSLSISDDFLYAFLYNDNPAYGNAVCLDNLNNWSYLENQNGNKIQGVSINFLDKNVGYYAVYDWTTGSGWALWIYKTIDGGKNWIQTSIPNNINGNISNYSSFSFSKDNSYGYFSCGQILLRTPFTGDFTTGFYDIKSEEQGLLIKQLDNELDIKSPIKTISEIEIYSVNGLKIDQTKGNMINISNLPRGGYLISAVFTDNTISNFVKWIKH